jgi:voltage-gated potassium channel
MANEIATAAKSLRRSVYELLEPSARSKEGLSWANKLIVCAILLATCVAVVATEESIAIHYSHAVKWTELILGLVFLIEYIVRFWVAPETYPDELPVLARAKFVFSQQFSI